MLPIICPLTAPASCTHTALVVASLIERAPRAGLRHDTPLPALSGVLADFLENLVGIGEPQRRRNNAGNLAAKP